MPLGCCLFLTYSVMETRETCFINRGKLNPGRTVIVTSSSVFLLCICIDSDLDTSHCFLPLLYSDTFNISSLCISQSIPLIPDLPLSPYHQPISNHPTPPLTIPPTPPRPTLPLPIWLRPWLKLKVFLNLHGTAHSLLPQPLAPHTQIIGNIQYFSQPFCFLFEKGRLDL